MALRWIAEAWRNQLDTFDAVSGNHRFYADFSQHVYPHVAGTPTYTAIASGANQPGDFNLTGSYAKYLLPLTAEVTVHVRCKPTFAYDTGDNQPLWSWYVGANQYLTLLYTAADDKLTLKWKDGGTERILQSAAFANNGELQVWMDVCASVDVTNGTGALYIDRASVDSSWSGATDTKTSYFPTFEIAAENGTAGDYDINHVRMFQSVEATAAQVANDFRDVKNEETYWPLDGHATGRTRTNITRFVREYVHDKEVEKPESGAQSANRLSVTLKSPAGEFADDQYDAGGFDPTNDIFNGSTAQKYLQTRTPVIAETWYGHLFEPFFVGRVDTEMYSRQTEEAGKQSHVTISAEDFVGEIANTTLEYGTYFEDKDLCDATETNSLVHLIGRLASQRRVYNYLANSSFENATIGDSWAVSGGTAPAFDKAAGGLFGASQGDLDYDDATCTVQQTVTFNTTGGKALSVGESWTFSIWLSSADNCAYNIYLAEADAGGDNDDTSAAWILTGGKGWKQFSVTHTITDEDSDRLIVRVSLDDDVVLSLDGAMLTQTTRALDWFALNNNDGSSAVESADDADYAAYEQIGYDCDAVDILHPWALVLADQPLWEHLKEIANGTGARYFGMDAAGVLRFRSPLKTGFTDPSPTLTITAARDVATIIDEETANKIVVRGVKIVKRTEVIEAWNAEAAGMLEDDDFDSGAYWPSTTDYPQFWAKYDNAEWGPVEPYSTPGVSWLDLETGQPRKKRVISNDAEQQVIGIQSPTMVALATRDAPSPYPIAVTQTTFDTTSRYDSAHILLYNGTAADGHIKGVSIRGKLVVRYSGSQGYINDKHINSGSVIKNGEKVLEVANNFIVTQDQVNQLADYYWKEYGAPKHEYTVTVHGERLYFEPGEWYTLDLGAEGTTENINSLVRCMSVSVQRNYGDIGSTSATFREVYENWKFDSNKTARFLASGNTMSLPGFSVVVASSTYVGPADYYCDGTADQVEIQAAIDYVTGAYGGGTVRLTEGTFAITAAIEMASNVALVGSGAGTILEKNCNDYCIEAVGTSSAAVKNFRIASLAIDTNSADTNAKTDIQLSYAEMFLIEGLTLTDFWNYGINIDGTCKDGIVRNCTFDNDGLSVNSGSAVAAIVGGGTGICLLNNIIRNFIVVNTGGLYGISIGGTGTYGYVISGNVINHLENNTVGILGTAIALDGNYCICQGNMINDMTSNTAVDAVCGIYIGGDSCQVVANRVSNVTTRGIYIGVGAEGTLVSGNIAYDNGNLITNGACE